MYQTYINPEGTILKVCELSMLKEINHFKCTFPWSLTGVFAWACSGTFQLQAWIALKLFFGVVDVFWHWGPDQDPKSIVLFGDVAPGNAPIQLGTGHNFRTINMQILHEQHQHTQLRAWQPLEAGGNQFVHEQLCKEGHLWQTWRPRLFHSPPYLPCYTQEYEQCSPAQVYVGLSDTLQGDVSKHIKQRATLRCSKRHPNQEWTWDPQPT